MTTGGYNGEQDSLAWLTRFCAREPAAAVAEAWLNGLNDEERKRLLEASQDDKIVATRQLRRQILDSSLPEVRADADSGWKYTGSVMRAVDAVLKVEPPKPRAAFKAAPAPAPAPNSDGVGTSVASGGAVLASRPENSKRSKAPKLVLDGSGQPGSICLWWSDFEGACDEQHLRSRGITHRLNVAKEVVGWLPDVEKVETIHVPMPDVFDDDPDLRANWATQLQEVREILRRLRKDGAIVNVNCRMGKNRSGCALLVLLCSDFDWPYQDSVLKFRDINALALANPHLLMALGDVLGVDGRTELNPANDGDDGGWVCISPPGSPRSGGIAPPSFEDLAVAAAAAKENSESGDAKGEEAEQADEIEKEEGCGDMEPLFGNLSDVD